MVPIVYRRQVRRPIITSAPMGIAQVLHPRNIVMEHIIITRRPPAMHPKHYQVFLSSFGTTSQMPRFRPPIVVPAPQRRRRAPLITQIDSGVGRTGPTPHTIVTPRLVRPRLVPQMVKPVAHYLLPSPVLHGPMPKTIVVPILHSQAYGGGARLGYNVQVFGPHVINPPQPIPSINPPTPGGGQLPDLVAACIAWLRLNAAIVAAFGDTVATPKFGSDIAARGISPPYLEFYEPEEDESYETADGTGLPSTLADGLLSFDLVCPGSLGKLGTRQLGELVIEALNDAPLTFLDGVLVYLRRTKRHYPTFRGGGPGNNIVIWKRTMDMDYKIERWAPQF